METAESEIETAVTEAYAEGYKAGMLQYAPDAAAYRALGESIEKELRAAQKRSRSFWPVIGVSIGISFATGFLLSRYVGR